MLALSWILLFPSQAAALSNRRHEAPDEILVKPVTLTDDPALARLYHQLDLDVVRVFPHLGWCRLSLGGSLTLQQTLEELRANPLFEAAEPNAYVQLHEELGVPDDPLLTNQWGMTASKATAAWYLQHAATNLVIALIDTGVRLTHEDLKANLWHNPGESGVDEQGMDKANNDVDDDENGYIDDLFGIDAMDRDTEPFDSYNHGTSVAGVIAGVGDNGLGIAGMNWRANLMILRIGFPAGSTTESQIGWIIECYDYLIMMKQRGIDVRVANNSYGASWFTSQALEDAFAAAGAEGILTVCSAGNDGTDLDVQPSYPASYDLDTVISVGSVGRDGNLAANASYGLRSVDLLAPGSAWSTDAKADNSYVNRSGSSYASAHVTGAIALMAAARPDLSAMELKQLLLDTVSQSPSLLDTCVSGGQLNVGRAMQVLMDITGPPINMALAPDGNATLSWPVTPPGFDLNYRSLLDPTEPSQPWMATPARHGEEWRVVLQPDYPGGMLFLLQGP